MHIVSDRTSFILDEILERLEALKPKKIILFGSRAWGEETETSDIDLYIVDAKKEMPADWQEKSRIYRRYADAIYDLQKEIPIDLVVHTQTMHRRFIERGGSFAKKIVEKGEVLYES